MTYASTATPRSTKPTRMMSGQRSCIARRALHPHPRRHRVVVARILPRLVEPDHLRLIRLHLAAREDPVDPPQLSRGSAKVVERANFLARPRVGEEPALGEDVVRPVRLGRRV